MRLYAMMSLLIDNLIKVFEERGERETVGKETSEFLPGYILTFSLTKIDYTKVASFSSNLLNKLYRLNESL